MNKPGVRAATAAIVLGALAGGCHQDDDEILKRLDAISQRVDKLAAAGPAVGAAVPQQPAMPRGPDPSKTYAIPADDLPEIGKPDALVTIVKAYEYACPFCEKARATEDQIRQEYGDKVRLVYSPFVVHPQLATLPMETACAAFKQGKFEQMNQLLWEKAFKTRQFDQSNMDALAREAELDLPRYAKDETGDCTQWVSRHQSAMGAFGVNGTPAFFVNGRYLSGAQPLSAFEPIINDELKKAEDRVAHGTPAASYYQKWVMDSGQKQL